MYTLQAIIAKSGAITSPDLKRATVVPLQQNFEMLPFTKSLLEENKIAFLPLTDEGLEELPENIESLCKNLSKENQLAYVEAEFFGGDGVQASAVFVNGKLQGVPIISESAINQALKTLGVLKNANIDEFDAIGLNEHRDTNKWVE
jgi:hypothetical protein